MLEGGGYCKDGAQSNYYGNSSRLLERKPKQTTPTNKESKILVQTLYESKNALPRVPGRGLSCAYKSLFWVSPFNCRAKLVLVLNGFFQISGHKKEAGEEQALALPCVVRQEALLSQPCDDESRDIMVRLQELQLKQTSLENPEPGEEQALALPSAVEAALLSQSSDAQDVVARLQEDLQLKQVSLKNPEPETKKMIRSLARKAKCSDRLDVVKHLREVTPAGTTGTSETDRQ